MVIVLLVVYVFFTIMTSGSMFLPSNFTALITQNAYVFVLGVGMLMCMLTGGNIDLSCGSFICLLGAVAGVFSVLNKLSTPLSIVLVVLIGIAYGVILGYLIAFLNIPPWIATLAGYLVFRGAGTEILYKCFGHERYLGFPGQLPQYFSGQLFRTPSGQLNIVCLVVGIAAAAVTVFANFRARSRKLKRDMRLTHLSSYWSRVLLRLRL